MLKRVLIVPTLMLLVTLSAVASNREDDVSRTQKAAEVFKQIMDTPDKGIPNELLESGSVLPLSPEIRSLPSCSEATRALVW